MRQSAFKQRLAKVIVDDNGCWLWRSRMGANGYGIEKSHLTGSSALRESQPHGTSDARREQPARRVGHGDQCRQDRMHPRPLVQ